MMYKIALGVAIVFIIIISIVLAINVTKLSNAKEELQQREIRYKLLNEKLQRASTQKTLSADDLDSFAKEQNFDIQAIKSDLRSLHGKIEAIVSTSSSTDTYTKAKVSSSGSKVIETEVATCPDNDLPIDTHGYTQREERLRLTDSNGMDISDVYFSAGHKNPWRFKVYGLRYKVLNSIGRRDNGDLILHTELRVSNPETQPGVEFPIKGISSEMIQLQQRDEFEWWSPSLYLAVQGGLTVYNNPLRPSVSPMLGFSVWKYKNWRFLGITAGFDGVNKSFRASLVPFLYNIGEPLPFLSDLWIFPDVGVDTKGSVSIGLGLGTRL